MPLVSLLDLESTTAFAPTDYSRNVVLSQDLAGLRSVPNESEDETPKKAAQTIVVKFSSNCRLGLPK
jgi:hypothetical protein